MTEQPSKNTTPSFSDAPSDEPPPQGFGSLEPRVVLHMTVGVVNSILTRGKGILAVLVVGAVLGPASLGVWAQIIGTVPLLACLALWGLDHRLAMLLPGESDEQVRRRRGMTTWLFGLISAAAIGLIVPWTPLLPGPYPDGVGTRTTLMAVLFVMLLAEVSRVFLVAYLTNVHRYGIWNALSLLYEWAEIGGLLVGIWLGWSLVLILMVVVIFRACVMAPILVGQLGRPTLNRDTLRDIKKGLQSGVPLMIAKFCTLGVFMVDRYAVDLTVGTASAGVFSMAVTLSRFTAVLTAPVYRVARPQAFKFWDRGMHSKAIEQLSRSFGYGVLVAAACAITVSLVGRPVMELVRPEYGAAGPFLPLLAVGYAACGLLFFPHTVLFLKRRIGTLTAVAVAALSLAVAGHSLLVPLWGPYGAALVTMSTYIIWLAALWLAAGDEVNRLVRPRLVLPAAAVLAMLTGLLLLCRLCEGWIILPAIVGAWIASALLVWRLRDRFRQAV